MMLLCPRCQRANPSEAAFCHFDGAELRAVLGGASVSRTRLPHEFVFPSGRRCYSYDDVFRGCQQEWDSARELLKDGVFSQFLATAGRLDLAREADQARRESDADVALDKFMAILPAKATDLPQLDLTPRRLLLGTLHVGDTKQVTLTVINQGKGLLHGTLMVAEGSNWLRLEEDPGDHCKIKALQTQSIQLRVDTHGLAAPNKYSARLTIMTNGGTFEAPVRLDLAVHPFPRPPFKGAASPRDMAERMRIQPKQAVPVLESDEVARWFALNGWTYPVLGPTARGVAAVQQFFEGMGLSRPPPVELVESVFNVSCAAGEIVPGQVVLRTSAKKWIYAGAQSDRPWLKVTASHVNGPQQAVLPFEVHASELPRGRVHEATLSIVANAGQKLSAQIRLELTGSEPPPRHGCKHPLLVGAVVALLLRLALALPADLYARLWMASPVSGTPTGTLVSWLQVPTDISAYARQFVFATWWLGAIAGALVLWRRGGYKTDILCGLVGGGVAGLAVSATVACLLPALDVLPRWTLREVARSLTHSSLASSPWLGTALWIVLAAGCWALQGAVAGFVLGFVGHPGARLIDRLANVLARVLGLFGLKRAAGYFALD
jgi:hypothetical protein